ncbi:MAG: quinolinate synthase NadA [Oscillospiraceae bacterium]|jgi:quinolinate synthase|nr:quinolinate synthase NadA [Oscillospiraceae bacterium]
MTICETQEKILRLKRERDVCVLAHSYQSKEILEIADFTGDSFALSEMAAKTAQNTVVMAGVRFMAETVKLLSPEKAVYLANPKAGCPMADQLTPEALIEAKRLYPDYAVVAYINTTAALKAHCDVCVTSSTAVEIVRKLDNPNILFIPDKNLGDYVARQIPEKNFAFLDGGCPIHAAVGAADVSDARRTHPGALLLVHPECVPDVVRAADFVGSTSAIMEYAKNSDAREFIIGTESSIASHLQYACPDKRFHVLGKKLICPNMRLTTLNDVCYAVNGAGDEIVLPPDTMKTARKCIDEMIRLGRREARA